ncbi:hypothetical protein Tco_0043389, partial [Tanacetum coccineum]
VRSKKSRGATEGERRALCYVQDSGRRKKKKMEAEIQRRLWDPRIKIIFRQHLEDKVVSLRGGECYDREVADNYKIGLGFNMC